MTDLEWAKGNLKDNSCVFVKDGIAFIDTEKGLRPLIRRIISKGDFSEYAAADRIVGRAAAFLYLILGVKELYAGVISEKALEMLKNNGVNVSFGVSVPFIQSHAGGLCPMEQAVENAESPTDALNKILDKIKSMQSLT